MVSSKHHKPVSGIYYIRNLFNDKLYIGSSKDVYKRFARHKRTLNKSTHHNVYLQRSWDKYGEQSFIFEVLEEVSKDELFVRESYWIDYLEPEYNIGSIGGGDNYSNHPFKESLSLKLAENLRYYKANLDDNDYAELYYRFGEDNPNFRHGLCSAYRECPECGLNYISPYALRCRSCENGDRFGERNSFFGKKHSLESKRKMSEWNKGKSKPLLQKAIVGDGAWFKSCQDAAEILGVSQGLISHRLNNDKYQNWFYSSNPEDVLMCNIIKNKYYSVKGFRYESLTQISEDLKIPLSTVSYRINSPSQTEWKVKYEFIKPEIDFELIAQEII